MSTENQARVIVVIEWVLFGIALIVFGIIAVGYRKFVIGDEDLGLDERTKMILKVGVVILFVFLIFNMYLNNLLTKGVHQEKSTACKVWYIINMVFMGVYILDLAVALITFNVVALIIQAPIFAYKVFAIMTIMKFTEKLITRPNVNNANGVVYTPPSVPTGAPNADPPPYFEKGQALGEGHVTVNLS